MTKCKDRVQKHLKSRIEDLETLFHLYQEGNEEGHPELGTFHEYGLCFDYVPAKTFTDQEEGFFRYQISYGGPQEEFRFITDNPNNSQPTIEFWLLDWFDGAKIELTGEEYNFMLEIWEFFQEIGSTESEFEKTL